MMLTDLAAFCALVIGWPFNQLSRLYSNWILPVQRDTGNLWIKSQFRVLTFINGVTLLECLNL